MEKDIMELKQRMAELVANDNLQYDDIYRIKLEMDVLIDKYYFEQIQQFVLTAANCCVKIETD